MSRLTVATEMSSLLPISFWINDTNPVRLNRFPVEIDAEITAHVDQFRLTEAIFLRLSEHFGDAAAPCLHDVHVGEGCGDTTVANLGQTSLHFLNGDLAVQHAGGGHLQPVIEERHLDLPG